MAMAEFENLGGFLEHVSLVMDNAADAAGDMVNLMTLHSAKGLEFDTVFLPGWEEGLFPNQRAMEENGLAARRGGAPARLCRADPRAPPRLCLVRRQPPHPRPVAECDALALCRRVAGRAYRVRRRARAAAGRRRDIAYAGGWGATIEMPARRRDEAVGRAPAARC